MKLTPWQLAIARGRNPYGWQIETLEAFGRGYPVALVACNGSGKTTEVAGSAVEWFFEKHPQGWLVATSSSFNQLQNQTWAAIETRLPGDYEVRRAASPLKIKAPGGGEGIGFSTKEAGRAEGWHPKISPEVDPVMILIDEAKTVPDAIWTAFDRCTVAYSLIISSPGPPVGRFFECFHSLKKFYWTRRVPSTECPHIPAHKRAKDMEIHGEDSALFRSMHKAEFTMDGQFLIIDPEAFQAAILLQPNATESGGETVAFFDFARGGDENVFALRRGNKIRIVDAWKQRDTVQAVRRFINAAQEMGLQSSQCFGDADGLGGPMVDQFKDEGFPINEFHGGSKPLDSVNYSNLISEVWIQGARRIQRGDFNIGEPDPETKRQLTTRLFEWDKNGKKRVESKDAMRKRGLPSPDRADAILGAAMCGSWMSGAVSADSVLSGGHSQNQFGDGVVTGW
jgi:hypothetical protein